MNDTLKPAPVHFFTALLEVVSNKVPIGCLCPYWRADGNRIGERAGTSSNCPVHREMKKDSSS